MRPPSAARRVLVAIPAHVYAVTGSVLATGVTLAFEHLPSLLLGPVSGVLADRRDHRRLMITASLAHAAAISVVLLARTPGTIWLVYAAARGAGGDVGVLPPGRAGAPPGRGRHRPGPHQREHRQRRHHGRRR
ncbi:MFS transporter, partial [Nonomuraea sp. FMUSA5-5]|nr:MFS transporter [Nonomuraea sp. FMUSA5-5]